MWFECAITVKSNYSTKRVAIVGAVETAPLGAIADMSQIQLHADAALNAMAEAGLKPSGIDGVATAGDDHA